MLHVKLILLAVVVTLATAQYKIEPRIVQGHDAIRGQFPFYVYLEVIILPQSGAICGASLISNQWIVTAAHCAKDTWFMAAHLGSLRSSDTNEEGRQIYAINPKDIHVHPKYSTVFTRK